MGTRIASVALAAPSHSQTADELSLLIRRSPEWIAERTGVLSRRIAPAEMSPAQLAANAAREALAATGAPDLILYAGALTQQLVPDTSAFVQTELKLEGVPCFTINQTCLSFLAAVQVADGLLKAGSYQRILICSGELATRGRNFKQAESAALLGDGGAAAVLDFASDSPSAILHTALETWAGGIDLCSVRAGNHPPPTPEMDHEDLFCFDMRGPRLYRYVRPLLDQFLERFLKQANCDIDDIKLVVPHQASGPGLRLLERFGFARERIVDIIAEYGNCVAASIPMALATAVQQGRINRGNLVLLVGTAAGVSLGATLLRW